MNEYTITIRLNKDQFDHFVENVGPLVDRLVVTVKPLAGQEAAPATPTKTAATPRQMRVSKVNDTIMGALGNGPQPVKMLKEALENADLSPGSLSTGIATLIKDGRIERVGDGVYGMVMAQAAE
jgi:hypothetical protein